MRRVLVLGQVLVQTLQSHGRPHARPLWPAHDVRVPSEVLDEEGVLIAKSLPHDVQQPFGQLHAHLRRIPDLWQNSHL